MNSSGVIQTDNATALPGDEKTGVDGISRKKTSLKKSTLSAHILKIIKGT
jgi:hypothetical protein